MDDFDIEVVHHEEAEAFINTYYLHWKINRKFYELVREKDYDFRMVNTNDTKSDSIRESLVHHIYVMQKYIYALRKGKLAFDGKTDLKVDPKASKLDLLEILDTSFDTLTELVNDEKIMSKGVKVTWNKEKVDGFGVLNGLYEHEILHTGWNLALMDHLEIPRFEELKDMWG